MLAGFRAVSGSLFFNSTGALGFRGGLGGKRGGSDKPREARNAPWGKFGLSSPARWRPPPRLCRAGQAVLVQRQGL